MKPRLYVQLGRYGDLLNILPLLHRDHALLQDDPATRGIRPLLMVAERFADLLDGVTYVEPIVWKGEFEDLVGAYARAEQVAEERDRAIVCTQIYARSLASEELCSSFLRESWARVPNSPPWGSLPLVFDRRDPTRERGVYRQLRKNGTGKPYVVLALNGTSSPFPNYERLRTYLRNKLREFDVVDVSGFKAPRLYDLLATLEGARALFACDSAVLHLAAAIPELRVFPFITRDPTEWHGTAWRPQHVRRWFYDETPECFADVLSEFLSDRRPTIHHVWAAPPTEIPTGDVRRIEFARATWRAEYANGRWTGTEFGPTQAKRDSRALGEERATYYMRDVIDHALRACQSGDVIAWTNSDVCLSPGITGQILDRCAREGCAYTHRFDFPYLDRPLASEASVQRGVWYPGSDAFFFAADWWRRHREEYPDLLVGRQQCDEVLRQLVKRHGGREIVGAVYHEKHPSYWEAVDPEGNKHNRRLAREWFVRTGFAPNDPLWWRVPRGSTTDRNLALAFGSVPKGGAS